MGYFARRNPHNEVNIYSLMVFITQKFAHAKRFSPSLVVRAPTTS